MGHVTSRPSFELAVWIGGAGCVVLVLVLLAMWLRSVRAAAPTVDSSRSGDVGMPPYDGDPEADLAAIKKLLADHGPWDEYRFPRPGDTTVRAYVREASSPVGLYVDLYVWRGFSLAGASRIPLLPGEDFRAATTCVWFWSGPPVVALDNLCKLEPEPDTYTEVMELPPVCRLPGDQVDRLIHRPPQ
jgi:hypothetical protein